MSEDGARAGWPILNRVSLHARVAILLAIAVSPIGAIGISQTLTIAREAARLTDNSLVDITRLAAEDERAALTAAFGASQALAITLPLERDRADVCALLISRFIESDPRFLFGAVVRPDGSVACDSSVDGRRPTFLNEMDIWDPQVSPRTAVHLSQRDPVLDTIVLNVFRSVYESGEHTGTLVLSMPVSLFRVLARAPGEMVGYRLALLDWRGEVFAESAQETSDPDWVPREIDLQGPRGLDEQVFTDVSRAGESRSYAIVPIVAGDIYAVGSWRHEDLVRAAERRQWLAVVFPASMWVLALGVCYFAVPRLAVRHISYLRRIMRAFDAGRRSTRAQRLQSAPPELAELGRAFDRMAATIEADERELQQALEEKNTLLREDYHRVKNNLQLVISMMNLQIRQSQSEEERAAITRLQDRVMGLAVVHQRLYQASDLTAVRCDGLLAEILTNLSESVAPDGSVRIEHELTPMVLGADQAIPLSLFATETVMNALKHGGVGSVLRVTLAEAGDGKVTFRVSNSVAQGSASTSLDSGLGSKLIDAFSRQIGGTVEVTESEGIHDVILTFTPAGADADPGEDEQPVELERADGQA